MQGFKFEKQALYAFQTICSGYFGDGVSNYLPVLTSNFDPPNLSLPSFKDYWCKVPAPKSPVCLFVCFRDRLSLCTGWS
jgi:hypothetical protein